MEAQAGQKGKVWPNRPAPNPMPEAEPPAGLALLDSVRTDTGVIVGTWRSSS